MAHEELAAAGLVLEDAESMGLLDPVAGAKNTAKAGYEENQVQAFGPAAHGLVWTAALCIWG